LKRKLAATFTDSEIEALDDWVSKGTSFDSFIDLVNAAPEYVPALDMPTLKAAGLAEEQVRAIKDAHDREMEARGIEKRATLMP